VGTPLLRPSRQASGALFGARFLHWVIGEAPTFPANAKAYPATGYPKDERSWQPPCLTSAAKFASGDGIPALGRCWCISAGDGFLRRRFSSVFCISALFYAFIRNPSEDQLLTAPSASSSPGRSATGGSSESRKGAPLGYYFGAKSCGLALGFASYNYTFYLLLTWLPSYLSTAHHVDLLHSALYTSVPWLFADAHRSCRRRLARRCFATARLERSSRSSGCSIGDNLRPGNSGAPARTALPRGFSVTISWRTGACLSGGWSIPR